MSRSQTGCKKEQTVRLHVWKGGVGGSLLNLAPSIWDWILHTDKYLGTILQKVDTILRLKDYMFGLKMLGIGSWICDWIIIHNR